MSENRSLLWITDRLRIREVEAGDLEELRAVFASNPDFLLFREHVAATGSGYDLASVAEYWERAALDPGRFVMVVQAKDGGPAIGLVDFVAESPTDGMSWIGLVMVDAAHQRRGIGSEALRAVAAHLALQGHAAVRMAVLETNDAGREFAESLGFEAYGTALTPMEPIPCPALLMELALTAPTAA